MTPDDDAREHDRGLVARASVGAVAALAIMSVGILGVDQNVATLFWASGAVAMAALVALVLPAAQGPRRLASVTGFIYGSLILGVMATWSLDATVDAAPDALLLASMVGLPLLLIGLLVARASSRRWEPWLPLRFITMVATAHLPFLALIPSLCQDSDPPRCWSALGVDLGSTTEPHLALGTAGATALAAYAITYLVARWPRPEPRPENAP